MGRMYDLIILEPMSSEIGLRAAEHVYEFLRKDIRWAVAGRDIAEMGECVDGLKGMEEVEGRSIPGMFCHFEILFEDETRVLVLCE